MIYSEMSDFEINKAVGDASGVEWAGLDENYHPLSIWEDGELCAFCPCNSWSAAGAIIEENAIGIGVSRPGDTEDWVAYSWSGNYCGQFRSKDRNPLRAAMIVFLMMQEGK